MVKRPDVKARKKLRIAMCTFYLLEEVLCTMPFLQDTKLNADGLVTMVSPYQIFVLIFGVTSGMEAFVAVSVICIALILIPIIGFLFCALDKERNLKNLVSEFCCIAGVVLILALTSNPEAHVLSFGAIFAILVYVLIMFLTAIAMVMRLSKD